jgi:hypothetical protein
MLGKAGEFTALPQTALDEMIERLLMRNHLPHGLRRTAYLNAAAQSSGC